MLSVTIVCVGKLKEPYLKSAELEYIKRLSAFCALKISEAPEAAAQEDPSQALIEIKLKKEAQAVERLIPPGSRVYALCIEGAGLSSEAFSDKIQAAAGTGFSKLCFIIGGSNGLHDCLKGRADERLSMSGMTFPHHLARIMLLEQLYRAFQISSGGRYHK